MFIENFLLLFFCNSLINTFLKYVISVYMCFLLVSSMFISISLEYICPFKHLILQL